MLQKLKPPIRDTTQLQIADLLFTVSQPKNLGDKFRDYLSHRYFKRQYAGADSSIMYFNRVRFFWGFALMDNALMCLDWVRVPWTVHSWRVEVNFISEGFLDIHNSWIVRSSNIIKKGIANRGVAENLVGQWFTAGKFNSPGSDIFTLYQRIGCPLPGSVTSYTHISDILMSPKFVLVNYNSKASPKI